MPGSDASAVRPSVYLETRVIGYATSRPCRDLLAAARQLLTREWFASEAQHFDLFVSQLVIDEIAAGDASAAACRLEFARGWPLLAFGDEVVTLAAEFVRLGTVPAERQADAVHLAMAAVGGVDYLLTWNFKHIANVATRQVIERVCRGAGYLPPTICTPEDLRHAGPR